jgi:hypothetical protein
MGAATVKLELPALFRFVRYGPEKAGLPGLGCGGIIRANFIGIMAILGKSLKMSFFCAC